MARHSSPNLSADSASNAYVTLHYSLESLRYDPKTAEIVPFAAKSYKISDDKLSVNVQLRDDLQWSDGKKVTAADYKFTWDKMMDEKTKYIYRQNYKDFKKPDDRWRLHARLQAQANLLPGLEPDYLYPNTQACL